MPSQASTRRTGKSQRRGDIVNAARALMRQSSDTGFSMRTLAEQAGVSIATPYNVFGSKQNVLLAVLNADLAEYEGALAGLHADGIDVLFDAVRLMSDLLEREPGFYRNVISAVSRDGPEFRQMVSGPRYILWKKLLRQLTDAGLLDRHADPDAFAIATSQQVLANILEWAHGTLRLEEMKARNRYGLALMLLAVATDRSRRTLTERMRTAEADLQRLWRATLAERLAAGHLDEEARELLADQLKHLDNQPDKT